MVLWIVWLIRMSKIGIFLQVAWAFVLGWIFFPNLQFTWNLCRVELLYFTLPAVYPPRMVQKTRLGLVIMDHALDFLMDQQLVPFGCFLSHQNFNPKCLNMTSTLSSFVLAFFLYIFQWSGCSSVPQLFSSGLNGDLISQGFKSHYRSIWAKGRTEAPRAPLMGFLAK